MHQPCQDQFLLLSIFSHMTLEPVVRFESSQFCKTIIFVFHPRHHQVTKSSQNTKTMELAFAPTMPRSIPFAPKLLPHHFGGICEDWVEPVFQNHDFRFSPHTPRSNKIKPKHQNHGTWLCTNHAKINSFCSQTSPTSLWRHFWGLSPASFPKPEFSFFTQHTTKSQNQAKTPKSWKLVLHQPCPNQFILLPNFSHITLEVFVRIESSQFSKTMIFVFHSTHHQVTK